MADNPNSPVFADRYRFEPVGNDWDRGRSGYTHLVYDLKEKRLGVIKRAETILRQSTDGLKNEVKALRALKGLGVPDVYDTGQALYGSKNYDYMVIEFIDGIRVEKNLSILSAVERAEIITKLFGLLSQAHQKGIVNGDVDLKHLFWRKDKKQIAVIDWGNARHGVDPNKKTEFAYDLARTAEIIYSLVTRQGHPPAIGPISLPDDSVIIAGMASLPIELRDLCMWAPRTPSDGAQAPYTAQELFEVSKKWVALIDGSMPYQVPRPALRRLWLISVFMLLAITGVFFLFKFLLSNCRIVPCMASATPSLVSSVVPSMFLSETPPLTETIIPSSIPTEIATLTQVVTPSTAVYSPIITFDQIFDSESFLTSDKKECWINEVISPSDSRLFPVPTDGFYRRTDQNWGFNVGIEHSTEDVVQVDYSNCLDTQKIEAIALNVAVQRLVIPEYEPAREFGVFLENQNGRRREYTLWLDKTEALYLRIRDGNNNPEDYPILVVSSTNLHFGGEYPRVFGQFPIQIFLEIDNNGFDVIYLLEGSFQNPVRVEAIDLGQMIPVNLAKLPTLGDIQRIGLLGRGGKTETLIWPLVFLEDVSK